MDLTVLASAVPEVQLLDAYWLNSPVLRHDACSCPALHSTEPPPRLAELGEEAPAAQSAARATRAPDDHPAPA